MKVYVSVDLEGITGLTESAEMMPGGHDFERARALMAHDANAAVAGAFDGGATDVLVCDAHGPAVTIVPVALIPARGWCAAGRSRGGWCRGWTRASTRCCASATTSGPAGATAS